MIPAGSSSGSVPLDAAGSDTILLCPMSQSGRAGCCLSATSWVSGDFLKHLCVLAGTEAVGSRMPSPLVASAEILPRTILVLPG